MNSVFLTIASYLGLGKHYMEIPPSNVVFYGKWIYLSQGPAILSPGFGRISFAFLLLSLTPPSKARRKLLWGVICTQFIADVGTIIIIYTQCRPVQGLWDESIERDCWPRNAQIYTGYFQGCMKNPFKQHITLLLRKARELTDYSNMCSVRLGTGSFPHFTVLEPKDALETKGLSKWHNGIGDIVSYLLTIEILLTMEGFLIVMTAVPWSRPSLKPSIFD